MSQSQDLSPVKVSLTLIADLEEQLQSKRLNAQDTSRVRETLCDQLSSFIVQSPREALHKDAIGRLWRGSIYNTINRYRSCIHREKRKNGPNLSNYQNVYHQFVSESISLYQYLLETYRGKMQPYVNAGSQEPSFSMDSDNDIRDKEMLVPIFYRLLLHLGDLYRYQTEFKEAERVYERASDMAPGMGSPYNQLAVIYQQKDPDSPMTCVALYFYARALKALHEPFGTSRANMERLWKANREWLQSNQNPPNIGVPTKNTRDKLQKAQRNAENRRFLAEFVDLHFSLYQEEYVGFSTRVENVLHKMDTLLTTSAFGELLWCRMVAINAFSVKDPESMILVYKFGQRLVSRVEQTVSKCKDGESPSLRYLVPTTMVAEHVLAFHNHSNERVVEAEKQFWKKVAAMADVLLRIVDDKIPLTPTTAEKAMPKDYKTMIGFEPFQHFIPLQSEYLTPEEALVHKSYQDSSQSGVENSMKMSRFQYMIECSTEKMLKKSDTGRFCAFWEDEVGAVENLEPVHMNFHDESASNASVPNNDSLVSVDDNLGDPGDVIVYKPSENGKGPALLVPGELLKNRANAASASLVSGPTDLTASLLGQSSTLESLTDPEDQASPTVAPAQAVRPSTVAVPTVNPSQANTFPGVSGHPPVQALPSLRPVVAPPPGFSEPAAVAPGHHNPPATLFEHLSRQPIQTANPFMDQPVAPTQVLPPNPVASGSTTSTIGFLDSQEETAFLDSSLLRSLWMDDKQQKPMTKNPFW